MDQTEILAYTVYFWQGLQCLLDGKTQHFVVCYSVGNYIGQCLPCRRPGYIEPFSSMVALEQRKNQCVFVYSDLPLCMVLFSEVSANYQGITFPFNGKFCKGIKNSSVLNCILRSMMKSAVLLVPPRTGLIPLSGVSTLCMPLPHWAFSSLLS